MHTPQEHIQTAPGNQGIFNRARSVEAHTPVIKGKLLVGVEIFVSVALSVEEITNYTGCDVALTQLWHAATI